MKAAVSSKTFVPIYQITRRQNQEDTRNQFHNCKICFILFTAPVFTVLIWADSFLSRLYCRDSLNSSPESCLYRPNPLRSHATF
jgi:hypothetical protein